MTDGKGGSSGVPEGWQTTRFGESVDIANGQVNPLEPPYCDYLHIGPENIESGSGALTNLQTSKSLGLISGKYLFDPNAIVYSKIRPNLNKVCMPDFVGICSADMYPIWPKENLLNKDYLFYFMQSDGFLKHVIAASGRTGLPKVNRQDLDSIDISSPPLEEQRKIAEILSAWDDAIEQQTRLVELRRERKRGLMQQLLTGRVRFREFAGLEWESCRFGNVFKRITRKNSVGNTNALTISGNLGLVSQTNFFNKRIASENVSGYYLLEKGEFAYNKSYSNGYPMGAMKRLDRYERGVLSTLYICFAINNQVGNSDFYAHYFESGLLNREISQIAQEGARNHGLLNVSTTDFFETVLPLPPLPEQQKIATVLSAADTEIDTLTVQLAALKTQKRGLMQRLLTGQTRVSVA